MTAEEMRIDITGPAALADKEPELLEESFDSSRGSLALILYRTLRECSDTS